MSTRSFELSIQHGIFGIFVDQRSTVTMGVEPRDSVGPVLFASVLVLE